MRLSIGESDHFDEGKRLIEAFVEDDEDLSFFEYCVKYGSPELIAELRQTHDNGDD